MSLIDAGYNAPPDQPDTIPNNGWWPEIDPAHFRKVERIAPPVTDERIAHALRAAMADVNRQLSSWQAKHQQAGAETVSAVEQPSWQVPDAYPLLYRRAVYATAHASLLERYREATATNAGDERGEAKDEAADDYRRDARWAVAELLGRNHTVVELI